MAEPKDLVDRLEQGTELPGGNEERFVRYGVRGCRLPLESSWPCADSRLLRSDKTTRPYGIATHKEDGLSIRIYRRSWLAPAISGVPSAKRW